MARRGDCSYDKSHLLFAANNFQQTMCIIIVRDTIYISWFMKKGDHMVTLSYLAFGGVQCSCDMLPWVSSLSNQYTRGSKSPPEAATRFIRICVHWPFVEYGQHLLETCYVLYLQKEIIQRELTRHSLSTMLANIEECWAITWLDYIFCRLGSTRAITVWLQSVHLNGHRWSCQLMI